MREAESGEHIVLKGVTFFGRDEKRFEFAIDSEIIRIRGCSYIDLTPISSCVSLKKLSLFGCFLKNIDLAPLSHCQDLRALILKKNKLETVDLTPLASCKNLQRLDLSLNYSLGGAGIDLAPLGACSNLQYLDLSNIGLEYVNINPLITCKSLKTLELWGLDDYGPPVCETFLSREHITNSALQGNFSIYDVLSWHTLEDVIFWGRILKDASLCWQHHHLLHEVMRIKGLEQWGLLDCTNPIKYTEGLLDNRLSADEFVDVLCKQIDGGGTTIGLDIDTMIQFGDLAARVDRVIRDRQEEVARVSISSNQEGYNLRPLALTAYGFQVLTALGMGLTTDEAGLSVLQDKFKELGLELSTTQEADVSFAIDMSESMRKYIWRLVEYNARKKG